MNYLRISNKGHICVEDLTLIGSSTKRDQAGKIGMFGSGWKYALAWLLRNDCTPTIYSGKQQLKVDFTPRMHRNNAVNIITVDGNETSLTTEMGPKWSGWMALREVISNAIDEGGHTITTQWLPQMEGVNDQTVIYIPMNGELSEVMMRYDSFFAFNRRETFSCKLGRIFLKAEKSKLNIYRKGIRCFDPTTESRLDFDFDELNINEDRLAYWGNITTSISNVLKESTLPKTLFREILKQEDQAWLPIDMNDVILNRLTELIEDGDTFTTSSMQKLGGMLMSKPGSLFIRDEWYKRLQDLGLVKSVFSTSHSVQFIRTDKRRFEGVNFHLKQFGVTMPMQGGLIESTSLFGDNHVVFDSGHVLVDDRLNADDKTLAAKALAVIPESEWKRLLM